MEFLAITKAHGKEMRYLFSGNFKMREGNWVMDIQYGYATKTSTHFENFDSCMPGKAYKMVHQALPHEGDRIIHLKSSREFIVGPDTEGFIKHKFPLMEGGITRAFLEAEEYYKD